MIKENNLFTKLSKEVQKEFLNKENTYATKELRNALEEETDYMDLSIYFCIKISWVLKPYTVFDFTEYVKLFVR